MDRNKTAIMLLFILLFESCTDMFWDKSKKVVGKIELISVNGNQESSSLHFKGKNGPGTILYGVKTVEVYGNDTILFVKSITQQQDTLYNAIYHYQGDTIKSVDTLTYKSFYILQSGKDVKYHVASPWH